MAIKLIHHVNVQISDRERTRAWYEKVLGAEFLDRGPALNRRQLQLRLGCGEIHFTVTPRPIRHRRHRPAAGPARGQQRALHLHQGP
jgi:catechol 2,3-dioxygenase-like lactoylglutathione lyase family enzyme